MKIEMCIVCDSPTGKAGYYEDSNYCPCGKGPYCDECYDKHLAGNETIDCKEE